MAGEPVALIAFVEQWRPLLIRFRFRSELVSVFRETFSPWPACPELAQDDGVAQLVAGEVRAVGGLDIVKHEPPSAHAHVLRVGGGRITQGQARKLRDAAMQHIVRMPPVP